MTGWKDLMIRNLTWTVVTICTSNLMNSGYHSLKGQGSSTNSRLCFKRYKAKTSIKQYPFIAEPVITTQNQNISPNKTVQPPETIHLVSWESNQEVSQEKEQPARKLLGLKSKTISQCRGKIACWAVSTALITKNRVEQVTWTHMVLTHIQISQKTDIQIRDQQETSKQNLRTIISSTTQPPLLVEPYSRVKEFTW